MNLSNCRRDMTIVTTNQTGDMTGYWNEICNNKVFFCSPLSSWNEILNSLCALSEVRQMMVKTNPKR